MSEDIYVYEAIDVEPAITEAEVEAKIADGEYRKVTWADDGRIGDGYFVKVGENGMIGIAMIPDLDANGRPCHRGIAVQADPLAEEHRDTEIEAELRNIVTDFGTAPDGTARRFEQTLYVQRPDGEYKVFVRDGAVVREDAEAARPTTAEAPLLTLVITDYEVDLLRQMVTLDIHDHKAGDAPGDPQDPGYNQRRVADCEALLAKLNRLRA
ncbi:hypothetical protein L0U85_03330 [Glycomyces sp. L485]|uniref:hypothetical protein n=1 Tax=Glycomyces sp. L485 TaxID=2909235 RepID=UPI001F4BB9C2|nr:hypothetical protein [Glycomyces sp. L485]MCH7229894.1 hypothetical protein [Glycomyces sp. L485]